ncbi:hypothetical protein NC652_012482 [Populus alba x Populus x berolinensis]|nr:hypothetical protein NC652_012482 [Populus alba x Populus x berolinensis]
MLLLFETPGGFALFKVLDEGKLSKVEDLGKEFSSPDSARKVVKLKAFSKFENTAEALEAATKIIESSTSKGLCGYDCALTSGHHRQQSPIPANEKGLPASLLRRHSEQITSMLRDKALSGHLTSLDLGYAPLEPPSLLSKPPPLPHAPLAQPRNHRLLIKYFLFVHQYLII